MDPAQCLASHAVDVYAHHMDSAALHRTLLGRLGEEVQRTIDERLYPPCDRAALMEAGRERIGRSGTAEYVYRQFLEYWSRGSEDISSVVTTLQDRTGLRPDSGQNRRLLAAVRAAQHRDDLRRGTEGYGCGAVIGRVPEYFASRQEFLESFDSFLAFHSIRFSLLKKAEEPDFRFHSRVAESVMHGLLRPIAERQCDFIYVN